VELMMMNLRAYSKEYTNLKHLKALSINKIHLMSNQWNSWRSYLKDRDQTLLMSLELS